MKKSGAVVRQTIGAVESLLSAVVADRMGGDRHNPNVELVAQGIANIASPLVGGLPATGAIARTATNIRAGARTPMAGMIHAATLLFVLLVAIFMVGARSPGGERRSLAGNGNREGEPGLVVIVTAHPRRGHPTNAR